MDILLQQILNGLFLGSIYALIALGYTMVYGILGLINFAHGEVVMIGAMVATATVSVLVGSHLPLPGAAQIVIAVLVATPLCVVLSLLIERIAYRPLRQAPRLAPLITAIGVSIVLQSVALMKWERPIGFPEVIRKTPLEFAGATITDFQLFIMLLAALIMAGLLLLVHKTKLGRAMRAVAQNPDAASLMGVNINQVVAVTFAIGAAMGAVAGVMVAANYGLAQATMGSILGLKAFTAAVLGGIGNLAGAMLGGILLGLIESLGAGYIGDFTGGLFGSDYQDVFAFLVLIGVLVFRPSGLLKERVGERA